MRIRSTEEPDEPPFFVADRIYLNLELAGLLRKKLVVEEGASRAVRIEIVYDDQGRSNLPKPVERADAGAPQDHNQTLPFLLEHFRASGPLIRFADQKAELDLELPQWTLSIDGDRATENHRIQFGISSRGDLDYQDRSLPLETVSANLNFRPGGLGVDRVIIEPGQSRIELTGEVSDMQESRLNLTASVQANGGELSQFAGLSKPVSGQFDVNADIQNRLEDLAVTARIHGDEVDYGEFQSGTLEAQATYAAGTGRAQIDSFSFDGPFGRAEGNVDLALNKDAGLSRADVKLDRFNLLTASREFDAPVKAASLASGSAELSWTALEFSNVAGSGELRLSATRKTPARDLLPASGQLRFQIADNRLRANLRDFQTLARRRAAQ
ncbi:MAG: hypothetical protein R2748_15040 [Bryobacterales bacterium]